MYVYTPKTCLLDISARHLMGLSRKMASIVNVRCLTCIKHFNQRLSQQNKVFTLLVQWAVVLPNHHVPSWWSNLSLAPPTKNLQRRQCIDLDQPGSRFQKNCMEQSGNNVLNHGATWMCHIEHSSQDPTKINVTSLWTHVTVTSLTRPHLIGKSLGTRISLIQVQTQWISESEMLWRKPQVTPN